MRCLSGWLWLTALTVAAASAGCAAPGSESQAEPGISDHRIADDRDTESDDDGLRLPGKSGASATDDDETAAAGNGPGEDSSVLDEQPVSPLSEFIRTLASDAFPETQKFSPDPMAVVEDMVYDCMTAQGFRYEVVDWAAIDAEIDAALPNMAYEESLTSSGYGFAESLDAPEAFETSYVDPNEAIKAGLSEDELEAWERQWGECFDTAAAERDRSQVIYFALQDDMAALRERINSDPRVVAATAGWSSCMADHGHSYTSTEELLAYLDGIADPLQDRLVALGGHDNIDAAFQADLDALMSIEIEIARADVVCSRRLDQVVNEVKIEHEQRFLDENEDRLALLREELPTMTVPNLIRGR